MTNKFFESKLYKTLELAGNLIALNLVFVLTSVPILTIGASYTALYSALNSDMSIRSFFSAYKKNWKQSTVVWIIVMVLIDLAIFNGALVIRNDESPSVVQVAALVFSVFLSGSLFSWVFPVISFFDNKTGEILKNSVLLGLSNLPVTFLVLILNLILPAELVFFTNKFVQFGWIWLGFGFSLIAFANFKLLKKAIERTLGISLDKEEVVEVE